MGAYQVGKVSLATGRGSGVGEGVASVPKLQVELERSSGDLGAATTTGASLDGDELDVDVGAAGGRLVDEGHATLVLAAVLPGHGDNGAVNLPHELDVL